MDIGKASFVARYPEGFQNVTEERLSQVRIFSDDAKDTAFKKELLAAARQGPIPKAPVETRHHWSYAWAVHLYHAVFGGDEPHVTPVHSDGKTVDRGYLDGVFYNYIDRYEIIDKSQLDRVARNVPDSVIRALDALAHKPEPERRTNLK